MDSPSSNLLDARKDPDIRSLVQWQAEQIQRLTAGVEELENENAELKRQMFGQRSERMPPTDREARKAKSGEAAAGKAKRSNLRSAKGKLPAEEIVHEVPVRVTAPNVSTEPFRVYGSVTAQTATV